MHPVLKEALERSPVMPVLVIPEISMAAPLAEALASGGLTVFEITLRTECALDAMIAMKKAVSHALIGAGTVTNTRRMSNAKEYGADFVVSPGTTRELWAASEVNQIPVLSGFSTASEAMRLMELGELVWEILPSRSLRWSGISEIAIRSSFLSSQFAQLVASRLIRRPIIWRALMLCAWVVVGSRQLVF